MGVVKRSQEIIWAPVCRLSKNVLGTSSPLPSVSPSPRRLSWEMKLHDKTCQSSSDLRRHGLSRCASRARADSCLTHAVIDARAEHHPEMLLRPAQYTGEALHILHPIYPQTSLRQPEGDEHPHWTGEENEADSLSDFSWLTLE